MEFSAFLVFAVWTSSTAYLTFGKEPERAMVFPDYYFFAERRLVNHTIEKKRVNNLDDCELMCYLNDDCVSLNFEKDPEYNEAVHICELNNATHLKYDSDLTTDVNFYYRGSKNACDKGLNCENNATCQSGFTFKGYRCLCPPGFEGEHCDKDTDKCEEIFSKCHKEATCNNTHGSYVCTCKPGFTGNGHNCTGKDIDECKGNHSCHENANCTNTIGSHVCDCQVGYTGNGQNCTDTNECETNPRKCREEAACNNTRGSFVCTCKPGFIGDGQNCTDVDECKGNHSCHENANCTNTFGSHVCDCQAGYTGDGQNCTDIEECKGNHPCHVNASCKNTIGSHECECHPGFAGNGRNCADIDECKTYPGKCHVNATCNNTYGSHVCACKPGYTGDGRNCTDIDECREAHADKIKRCHPSASCINTQGSYNCSCNPNYIGDGFHCEADPCITYKKLSDANRRSSYNVMLYGPESCDKELEGWYRFVGAAGTRMPTERVEPYHCGTDWSGWLEGAHPAVEDDEVQKKVCFSNRQSLKPTCRYSAEIYVKNCGSYYIYKLVKLANCNSRYCATD